MNADDVRREWETRSTAYSPTYYAYHGPNETSEVVRETLDRYVGRDAAVMEVGCSAGRHLKHLHDHGYEDLHGVDINVEALDVMRETYPALASAGTFHRDAIENALPGFDDARYEAVFSVETLQHVHPDDTWVFDDLARVCGDVLVTVENEGPDDEQFREEPFDVVPVDGRTNTDRIGERADADTSSDGRAESADVSRSPPVNFVEERLPLYYRRWEELFAERGLEAVTERTVGRDTLRVFRHA